MFVQFLSVQGEMVVNNNGLLCDIYAEDGLLDNLTIFVSLAHHWLLEYGGKSKQLHNSVTVENSIRIQQLILEDSCYTP